MCLLEKNGLLFPNFLILRDTPLVLSVAKALYVICHSNIDEIVVITDLQENSEPFYTEGSPSDCDPDSNKLVEVAYIRHHSLLRHLRRRFFFEERI